MHSLIANYYWVRDNICFCLLVKIFLRISKTKYTPEIIIFGFKGKEFNFQAFQKTLR
jgi:hypothetical protein